MGLSQLAQQPSQNPNSLPGVLGPNLIGPGALSALMDPLLSKSAQAQLLTAAAQAQQQSFLAQNDNKTENNETSSQH